MNTLILLMACAPSPTASTSDDSGVVDTGAPTTSDIVSLATGDLDRPVDAAPDADGAQFYVLTEDAGLWAVPADGSSVPTLVDGTLRGGRGLLVSLDGTQVFVTAQTESEGPQLHAIHLDGTGDVPHPETLGLDPGGLTGELALTRASHNEQLYFTGRRAGAAVAEGAVYGFAPHGEPILLAVGFGGAFPTAVEAASDRSLYVAAVDGDAGSLWYVPADVVLLDGAADPTTAAVRVFDGFRPGDPSGIALTADGATLLISSLSAQGTSQVILYDTATGGSEVFDEVIGANHASGGVHRARDVNVFAWADRAGGVYRVCL